MKAETKIKQTEYGHKVEFTIGDQTFSLQELIGTKSKELAMWYKTQLDTALFNLSR